MWSWFQPQTAPFDPSCVKCDEYKKLFQDFTSVTRNVALLFLPVLSWLLSCNIFQQFALMSVQSNKEKFLKGTLQEPPLIYNKYLMRYMTV